MGGNHQKENERDAAVGGQYWRAFVQIIQRKRRFGQARLRHPACRTGRGAQVPDGQERTGVGGQESPKTLACFSFL